MKNDLEFAKQRTEFYVQFEDDLSKELYNFWLYEYVLQQQMMTFDKAVLKSLDRAG